MQPKFNNKRHLDLKRVLTPYPFDEYNTAINVLAEQLPKDEWLTREDTGVLWAKNTKYVEGKHHILEWVTNHMPLHTSFGSGSTTSGILNDQTRFIHHGFTDRHLFFQRMTSSRFLLGVGEPIDGPTALEAIAHGAAFINAKLDPPLVFDKEKPTSRPYTSQHPFAATFGEPYVYTIDVNNRTAIDEVMEKIRRTPPKPFRHQFNSPDFYVENLRRIFGEEHNKCNASTPIPSRHPGNNVYPSYEAWKQHNCDGGCQSHWTIAEPNARPFTPRDSYT